MPTTSGATSRGELRRKVEAAGFEIVRMTSFVSLLLPMMVASRSRMRDGGTTQPSSTRASSSTAAAGQRGPRSGHARSSGADPSRASRSRPADRCCWSRASGRDRGAARMIPFNRPYMTGRELVVHRPGARERPPRGRRAVLEAMLRVARGRIGSQKALLTHSCTAALEMAAILSGVGVGRRGHHAVVHVRLDGQRLRAARRDAGVRRHPARHAEHRRDEDRGGDHAAHEGDRAVHYAASAATWTRSWRSRGGTICWSSRTRRRGSSRRTADRPLGSIGHLAALSFHETKNIISGEGGALLVNDAALRRARRDHLGEGHQPRRSSSAARSTSTPGSTSARRICRARSSRRSSGRRWRRPTRITRRRLDIWAPVPRSVRRPRGRRDASAGRSSRVIAATTRTCYYLLLPSLRVAHALHRSAQAPRASSPSSTTSRCTRRHSAGRWDARSAT